MLMPSFYNTLAAELRMGFKVPFAFESLNDLKTTFLMLLSILHAIHLFSIAPSLSRVLLLSGLRGCPWPVISVMCMQSAWMF